MPISFLSECESKLREKISNEINLVSIDKIIDMHRLLHLDDLTEDGEYCIFNTIDLCKFMKDCIDTNKTLDYFYCIYDTDFSKDYHVYSSANSMNSFSKEDIINTSAFMDIKDIVLEDLLKCKYVRDELLSEIGDCLLYDYYELYSKTVEVLKELKNQQKPS